MANAIVSTGDVQLGNLLVTADGGLAIKLTNKTGGASVKGYIVAPSTSTNAAFELVGAADDPDIIGVVYEAGVADGSECWVVFAGKAYVYFIGAATRDHMARSGATSDTGETAGQAVSEALPSSPFATDKHFQEVGHVLETTGGAGLALCILHFN